MPQVFFSCLVCLGFAAAEAKDLPRFSVPPQTLELLDSPCFACHDEVTQKGEVRLDHLGELILDVRLSLLNKVQEQLFFGEMPPRKKKKQPTEEDRPVHAGLGVDVAGMAFESRIRE